MVELVLFLFFLRFPLEQVQIIMKFYCVFCHLLLLGFPDSSVGKESTCNAGDPNLIPWPGRSTGEGISYPLQCSWASLVTELVKNPPALHVTWVQSLGWVAIPFSRVFSQPKDRTQISCIAGKLFTI